MGKTNFQYDESGNTFYYFLLTFLSFILFPSTYYFWPQEEKVTTNIEGLAIAVTIKNGASNNQCQEESNK